MRSVPSGSGKNWNLCDKMSQDWEKARDWLKQKSITRMSAKVKRLMQKHNLHNNFGNWCIFLENELIYQGKWLKPQIVSGAEIIADL